MSRISIYKKGQGKYTRGLTFLAVVALTVIGAYVLSEKLSTLRLPVVRYGVPTLITVGIGALMFWWMNRPKTADFLIATEGEMKKVSWSTKKEIIGSTKVVIVFTLVLAILLFGVDVLFATFFSWIGVMG